MVEEKAETKTTPTRSRSTRSTSTSSPSAARSTRSTRSSAPTTAPTPKKVSPVKQNMKTWSDKVSEKDKKLNKLLNSSRKFGGRLSDGMIKEIKKRVSDKGPAAVTRMHFLGTVRQRKELKRVLESILDA